MAVMFCEGLPCSEKPPSTVWLPSGRGCVLEVVGVGNVEAEAEQRRGAAVAEIHREIVGVDRVHECLEAQRAIPGVDGSPGVEIDGEFVVEVVLQLEAQLLELGDELVDQAFRAHVHAIEKAVDQGTLVVELGGANRGHRLAVVAEVASQ
jgi:hypothetical protein